MKKCVLKLLANNKYGVGTRMIDRFTVGGWRGLAYTMNSLKLSVKTYLELFKEMNENDTFNLILR